MFLLRYLAGEINVLDHTVFREKSVRAKPQSKKERSRFGTSNSNTFESQIVKRV